MIDYIAEYLTSYSAKIKALNANGLFESAVMFELFAQQICNIWFEKPFSNLNQLSINYPCVDLVSDDESIFVQVSTAKDVNSKVRSTLDRLNTSREDQKNKIQELYFFMLDGDANKVSDYTGDEQPGKVVFSKENNLITIDKVISKAKYNLSFLQQLYGVLHEELPSYEKTLTKLKSEIDNSKRQLSLDYSYYINGEYELLRNELLQSIKNNSCRNIIVLGDAGSGKSALCKKMLEEEDLVLYARAERFLEETDLDGIWHFNIEEALRIINGRRIVFYIDALEFISDASRTRFDLIDRIYNLASRYKNVVMLASCRTNDWSAFIHLQAHVEFYTCNIELLSEQEIDQIAARFPKIRTIRERSKYSPLLKKLFYVNLFVERNVSVDDIDTINDLQEYIWENELCLKNKKLDHIVDYNKVRETVETIALDRAKEFLIGVDVDQLDVKAIHALESGGIITVRGNRARFKYDIYEDICFEHFFDKKFTECRGNYEEFFSFVEGLGRCAYRRYQIWVEDKLFTQVSRNKFLYELIIRQGFSEEWKDNTIVGITKSNYCEDFFNEYGSTLDISLLERFIDLTNLYSFSIKSTSLKNNNYYSISVPCGNGRMFLIGLVFNNNYYQTCPNKTRFIKLCEDYSKQQLIERETAEKACTILEYYVQQELDKAYGTPWSTISKVAINFLDSIYRMAQYSKDWITAFWGDIEKRYKESQAKEVRWMAQEIVKHTIKNVPLSLIDFLPEEFCKLMEGFWTYEQKTSGLNYQPYYFDSFMDCGGLNQNARDYSSEYRKPFDNSAFVLLAKRKFWTALKFAITISNHIASSLYQDNSKSVAVVEIFFDKTGEQRSYYACPNFWLACSRDGSVHAIVEDLLFLLEHTVDEIIKGGVFSDDELVQIVDKIKTEIFNKSNNIIMFLLIKRIGTKYIHQFPGYCFELATCIEIILWDIERVALQTPNANRDLLEKQILSVMGLPKFEWRYNRGVSEEKEIMLREYILYSQFALGDNCKERAENIIDYLYSRIPNELETAQQHLQIQKMDLRISDVQRIHESYYLIKPRVTGEAKKIVDEHENIQKAAENAQVEEVVQDLWKDKEPEDLTIDDYMKGVDLLHSFIQTSNAPYKAQNLIILFISACFSSPDLQAQKRSEYCLYWIAGIRAVLANHSFIFDAILSRALFQQCEHDLTPEAMKEIKQLMLDCILYEGQNGFVGEIKGTLIDYLRTNNKVARSLFYTIIGLSYKKLSHPVVGKIRLFRKKRFHQRQSNFRERNQLKKWSCHVSEAKNRIIRDYLVDGNQMSLSDFNINDHDLNILCHASSCGLNLSDPEFLKVSKQILSALVELWSDKELLYSNNYIFYAVLAFRRMLEFNLRMEGTAEPTFDVLFNGVKYELFSNETIEFYQEILSALLPWFFDSYKDVKERDRCKRVIEKMEQIIDSVSRDYVRERLLESLLLSLGRSHFSDWNELITRYSYSDKMFLNELWGKYGAFHLKGMLDVIYQFQIRQLLPETITAVEQSFRMAFNNDASDFSHSVYLKRDIINQYITTALVCSDDQIKSDLDLVHSYESMLTVLIDIGIEEAAIVLDEFRTH